MIIKRRSHTKKRKKRGVVKNKMRKRLGEREENKKIRKEKIWCEKISRSNKRN
jgi:hypothetical protein